MPAVRCAMQVPPTPERPFINIQDAEFIELKLARDILAVTLLAERPDIVGKLSFMGSPYFLTSCLQ